MTKETIIGISYLSIASIVNLITAFFSPIILTRVINPTDYGIYTTSLWLVSITQILISLGLPSVARRYVAEYDGKQDRNTITRLLSFCLRISICAGSVCLTLLILLSNFFASTILRSPTLTPYLAIFFVTLIPMSLLSIFSATLNGLRRFKLILIMSLFSIPNVGLQIILAITFGLVGMYISAVISNFVTLLAYYFVLTKFVALEFDLRNSPPVDLKQRVVNFSFYTTISILLDVIVWRNVEVLFLGLFRSQAEVAFYSIAVGISAIALTLPGATANVLDPIITVKYTKEGKEPTSEYFRHSTKYLGLVFSPLFIAGAYFSPQLVGLVFSQSYFPISSALRVLFISSIFTILSMPGSSIISSAERVDITTKVGLILAIFTILLDFILIPRYGIVGAAMVNLLVRSIAVIIGMLVVCEILGSYAIKGDILKVSASLIVEFVIISLAIRILPNASWIAVGFLGITSFYFIMFLIDKKSIISLLGIFHSLQRIIS